MTDEQRLAEIEARVNAATPAHAREDVPWLVARVRALVDKLPKTADGAPLLIGEDIFYDNRDRSLGVRAMSNDDFPQMMVCGLFILGNAHHGAQDMKQVELLAGGSSISTHGTRLRCYSSPESAARLAPLTTPAVGD